MRFLMSEVTLQVGAADGDEFARANTLEFFQVSAQRNTNGALNPAPDTDPYKYHVFIQPSQSTWVVNFFFTKINA